MNVSDFTTPIKPTACPGCGDYGVLNALRMALVKLNLSPAQVAIAFGIGCMGNSANNIRAYGIHTLHGRPIAVAQGIKLANHELTVLSIAGDGDTFGIGANHLIHAARRNINITVLVADNHRYSLTTGQASPTTDLGDKTKSTLNGSIEQPFNPIAITLSAGASFVARGFAGTSPAKLADLIVEAVKHPGFALVDILQPCITFNDLNTFAWYQKRVYDLQEKKYEPKDKVKAFQKAQEWGDKIPLGVFYKEIRPTYESEQPQLSKKSLIEANLSINNMAHLMDEMI